MSDTILEKGENTNIINTIRVITILTLFELQNLEAILRLKECGFYEKNE
jgi:hypothetical protein